MIIVRTSKGLRRAGRFVGGRVVARLPLMVSLLATVTLLLACDGCWNHRVEPEEIETVISSDGALTCRQVRVSEVPDSVGPGPIRATARSDRIALAHARPSDQSARLDLLLLDQDLRLEQSYRIEETTTGPLMPEALAWSRSELALVARQTGGRRAYFFTKPNDGDVALVEAPLLGTLDRRIGVRTVTSRTGGGVQVVSHISGATEIDVGRLAGSLLVTRSLEVPPLMAMPEAVEAQRGELALLTVERLLEGRRVVRMREVQADATPARTVDVAEVEPGARVEQAAILYGDAAYQLMWLVTAGELSELRRARIDFESMSVELLMPIRPNGVGDAMREIAAVRSRGVSWVLWTANDGESARLWASANDDTGREIGRLVLREVSGVSFQSPQIVALADRLAVFWREVPRGELEGPVFADTVRCSSGP